MPPRIPLPTPAESRATPAQVYLQNYVSGAEMARENGVAKQTHQKHNCSWRVWLEFLHRIQHSFGPYLETVLPVGQLHLCGAFMHAVGRGDFGKTSVQGDTARTALDHVATKFVESGRRSPVLNSRGSLHVHIDR